jgi:hypothetical protein
LAIKALRTIEEVKQQGHLWHNASRPTRRNPLAQPQHLDIDGALKAEQERLTARKVELETELAELHLKLSRIARYFTDEPVYRQASTPRRQPAQRTERGEVQTKVREAIYSAAPDGLSTGKLKELLEGVNYQSILNAIEGLARKNEIIKGPARGKHRPITIEPAPPAEAEAPK